MRKAILRRLALWFIPPIGALLIKVIYLTSKKEFNLSKSIPDEPFIVAFWHGDLLLQPYIYHKLRKTPRIRVLISDHFDGKIIASTIEYFKLETIHGSSTRGAAKVLISGMKSLRDGYDIGITPDGPKGPRHSMSDGTVAMAQKQNAKIVVFSVVPSKFWQLRSWDRFVIPKPFSSIQFYASEPIDVANMELEAANELIKTKLLEHRYADAL